MLFLAYLLSLVLSAHTSAPSTPIYYGHDVRPADTGGTPFYAPRPKLHAQDTGGTPFS